MLPLARPIPGQRPRGFAAAALLGAFLHAAALAADYAKDVREAINTISADEMVRHLIVLASDRYEGRFTGSFQGKWTGDYIASHFALFGMQPGGENGYFQPYPLAGGFNKGVQRSQLPASNRLLVFLDKTKDRLLADFALGDQFCPLEQSGSGRVHQEVVFAGWGIDEGAVHSYAGLEARGKIALVLDGVPPTGADASAWTRRRKVELAHQHGVQAVVFVSLGDEEMLASAELRWPPDAESGPVENGGGDGGADDTTSAGEPVAVVATLPIPAVGLSRAGREQLAAVLGSGFETELRAARKSGLPKSKDFPARIELSVHPKPERFGFGRNVIGIWPGHDPELAKEHIVISAHYDHIGLGLVGRMKGDPGEIFNGCDDNASGTSGLLEIARALQAGQVRLRRSVMLIAFDSEEIGLVGSEHFIGKPTVPLGDLITDLNMDMICKGDATKMLVGGRDSSKVIDDILGRIAARFNLTLDSSGMEEYINRSDQKHFLDKGIPAIFLFGGIHNEYHSPEDDFDSKTLRPKKMETIAKLMLLVAVELSERDGRP